MWELMLQQQQQEQLLVTEEGTAAQPLKPLWKPTENVAPFCIFI